MTRLFTDGVHHSDFKHVSTKSPQPTYEDELKEEGDNNVDRARSVYSCQWPGATRPSLKPLGRWELSPHTFPWDQLNSRRLSVKMLGMSTGMSFGGIQLTGDATSPL